MSSEEPSYNDGDIVWVKWSSFWWPGEVWQSSRVPEDVYASLRKPPIAFVKFFQEDSYELVRNNGNIMKYNCDKKMEHIRKGMEKFKTGNKIMENFPADVVKAEKLTGGNPNILNTISTPSKPTKPSSAAATPQSTPEQSKKTLPAAPKSSQKSHNSVFKVQSTPSTSSKEQLLKCTVCDFETDRMKVLIYHLTLHSNSRVPRVSAPTPVKQFTVSKSPARKANDDSIADDVRKIKESMQESMPVAVIKKTRGSIKSTPTETPVSKPKARASRSSKKNEPIVKEQPVVQPPEKPNTNRQLKKELLADWMDEDDDAEIESSTKEGAEIGSSTKEALPEPVVAIEKPTPSPEKVGESSRSIRNIPKKQRISEVYIQHTPTKPVDIIKSPPQKSQIDPESAKKNAEESELELQHNKVLKSTRRKRGTSDAVVNEPEAKKISEDYDQLMTETEDLLNETEVPKVDDAKVPSTFHKSTDIDKRNLPPKERNKRIFRAKASSPVLPIKSNETSPSGNLNLDNNGTTKLNAAKNDSSLISSQNELMLPHKKKYSSRLLASQSKQEQLTEPRTRKKRKSSDAIKSMQIVDVNLDGKNDEELSPLREPLDANSSPVNNSTTQSNRRGIKRRNSKDAIQLENSLDPEIRPEHKKAHMVDHETQGRTIVACSSEAICITSKGNLSVARRDSIVTTQANSVKVTSQVIISQATKPTTSSIISSNELCSETVVMSKPRPSPLKTITLKHALKISPENLEEMKRQGLVAVENNLTRLTPKGMQQFKEKAQLEQKIVDEAKIAAASPSTALSSSHPDETVQENIVQERTSAESIVEPPADSPSQLGEENNSTVSVEEKTSIESEHQSTTPPSLEEIADDNLNESVEMEIESGTTETAPESNISPQPFVDATPDIDNESTNNNDTEKEPIEAEPAVIAAADLDESEVLSKDSFVDEIPSDPLENGKESDEPETNAGDDANESSGGLIAIAAESFGGPQNCFYLCRQVDGRYEPVDNQILVLNAQNALVPFEGEILPSGEILTEDMLTPTDAVVAESLTAYPQMSPNSNIIINTPTGRKVELDHQTILTLQQQTDENGIATIDMDGEQLELNVAAILEAIGSQHDDTSSADGLIAGTMLIEGDEGMIIDADIAAPIEMHHSATQVSETLSKPIMSTTIAPEIAINPTKSTVIDTVAKNLNIEDSLASIGVTTTSTRANVPKSLELPITVTDPLITETVNHRKLANATLSIADIAVAVVPEGIVVVQTTGNGSSED